MKKLLWIVPLVLVVALAAAAWFIGGTIEKNIDPSLKSIAYELSGAATQEGALFTFTTEDYERGFLSSTATTKMSLSMIPNDENPIILKSKIYHGPLMFTSEGVKVGASFAVTTLDMEKAPADVRKVLEEGFDNEPPLKIATMGSFSGAIESDVTMPLFRHTEKEDLGGMSTETKIQFAGLQMTFSMPGIEGGGAKGTMKTGEMKMTQKMQLASGGDPMTQIITLGVGEGTFENTRVQDGWHSEQVSKFTFPELAMDFAEFGISLKGITAEGRSEIDDSGSKFEGFSRISYDSGEMTGDMAEQAGDQPIVQEALALLKAGGLIEVTFEGLDAAALADIEKLMNSFSKTMADPLAAMSAPSGDSDEEAMDPDAAFKKVLALFQPGMKIGIRQKMGDGEKRNELSLALGFVGKSASEAETIGDFVNGLRGEVSARLSKTTVDVTPLAAMLGDLIEGGMVEDRGDNYRAIGELVDGKVSLNGTEMPVMDQFAPMMDQEFSIEGLMGVFMGMGGGGFGIGPGMEDGDGFPGGADGFDAPADPDAKSASPDPLAPDAPSPNATPVPDATPVPQ